MTDKNATDFQDLEQDTFQNDPNISGQHHSFDMGLAKQYGLEEALIIHHFQHWVRVNQRLNRNFKDGRTWTYQTRKEIQAHFPYLSIETIKYAIESLVKKGVLVTRNFNKSPMDKTLWYAFAEESKFVINLENSKNVYERENSPSKGKIPSCYVYKDTDTKTTDNKKKVCVSPASDNRYSRSPSDPRIGPITSFFISKLKEINPKLKSPNIKAWEKEMHLLLNTDKRSEDEVKEVLNFIVEQHKNPKKDFTWSMAVQSPQKLRKHYAAIWLELNKPKPTISQKDAVTKKLKEDDEIRTRISENRNWGYWLNKRILKPYVLSDTSMEYVTLSTFDDGDVSDKIYYKEKNFKDLVKEQLKKYNVTISK